MQQPLRGTQKLVLLCLADWANHEHRTWHTTRDVVARVGVDRSAVFDALRHLEAGGFVRERASARSHIRRMGD